jgi:hypothetical protein
MRRRLTLLIAGLVMGVVAVAGAAWAADPRPEVALTIDKDQFQPSEIKVKANTPFTLVVTNKNAKAAEFESKDLRIEKVVPAGKTVNVLIRALKPGTYAFFDDFPYKAASGRIVASNRRPDGRHLRHQASQGLKPPSSSASSTRTPEDRCRAAIPPRDPAGSSACSPASRSA